MFSINVYATCAENINFHPSVKEILFDKVEAEFRKSKHVFKAAVAKSLYVDDHFLGSSLYHLDVLEVYKGSLSNTLKAINRNLSTSFNMEKGKEYLVFIDELDGIIEIDGCGQSTVLNQNHGIVTKVESLSKNKPTQAD